jgi:AraC-like DNA-binding protein
LDRILLWIKQMFTYSQNRLILTLTLVIIVLIASVGLISYSVTKRILLQEIYVPVHTALTIDRDLTDQFLKRIDSTAIEIILSNSTTDFLRSNENEYEKSAEMVNFLNTVRISQDIESIYVYDIEKRRLATTNYGYVSDISYMLDDEWIQNADQINNLAFEKRNEKGKNSEVVSLFRPIYINAMKKGILVVNMSIANFFSKSAESVNSNERSLFILETNGNVIFRYDNKELNVSDIVTGLQQNKDNEIITLDSHGENYLIFHLESAVTKWKFVTVIPEKMVLKNIKGIRNTLLMVSFLFALMSVVMIGFINHQLFKPIKRLRKLMVRPEYEHQEQELLDMRHLASRILQDHSSMSKQIKTSLPEIQKRVVQDLFFEKISSIEIFEKWRIHFTQWDDAPFYVIVISIDDYVNWGKKYNDYDQGLLQFALGNIMEECLRDKWRVIFVEHGRVDLVVLLQPRDDRGTEALHRVSERIIEEAERYLKMSVSIGLGNRFDNILQASDVFRKALSALYQRLYKGYGLVYSISVEYELKAGHLEEEWLKPLTGPLQTGDTDSIRKIWDRFFEQLESVAYSPSDVIAFLEKLQVTLEKVGEDHGGSVAEAMKFYANPKLSSMRLKDIEVYYRELLDCIVARIDEKKESKTYTLLQQMIDYMRLHLKDNIGVKDIADSVDISVYIANQYFKQETSHTVYEYMTNLRIEESKRLLSETELKIFEIAEMVGYQNENSFIRSFRNTMGMTPGRFREMRMEQEVKGQP